MSRFFVGQRVRKARGDINVGATGVVVEIDPKCPFGHSLLIRSDAPMRVIGGLRGEDRGRDLEGWGRPDEWEPILDQKHEACDEDFKRYLDKLLERQGESA